MNTDKEGGFTHQLTIQTGESELFSVRWSPEDTLLAAASSDGTVKILSSHGSAVTTLPCYQTLPYPVTSVRWRPPGAKTRNILLTGTCDGCLYHYHVSSSKVLYFTQLTSGILSLDYSPEGSFYTLGCSDSSVQVFDESTKSMVKRYDEESGFHHSSRVMCVKWSSPSTFWTGGWDKLLVMWDTRTNRSVRHINNVKLCGESIDFTEQGMVTAEYEVENQLKLWDTRSCKLIKSASIGEPGEKCLLYSVKTGPNLIATCGSGKNTAYFLSNDLSMIGIVAGIEKPSYSLDFAHNSRLLAVSSGDGSVRVFST